MLAIHFQDKEEPAAAWEDDPEKDLDDILWREALLANVLFAITPILFINLQYDKQ